jgi:hypothetical protein
MTKNEFMKKHRMTAIDYKNLVRYEDTRKSGVMNMNEYIHLMKKYNANGGSKLADWIVKGGNYEEFLSTLGKEKENEKT